MKSRNVELKKIQKSLSPETWDYIYRAVSAMYAADLEFLAALDDPQPNEIETINQGAKACKELEA